MTAFSHKSVLLPETIQLLNIRPDGIYLDGTTGGGGHSEEIAKRLTAGHLFCIDQDRDALKAASERLLPYAEKITFVHANFSEIENIVREYRIPALSGIVLDLGVSSYQFDEGDRGFSYRFDSPLDMRMDQSRGITAMEIVNQYSASELARIFRCYGEEPFANNIAKHIVKNREEAPLTTTFQLVEIIKAAVPAKIREKGGHPAKRVFQALRIETNSELDVLTDSLEKMTDALGNGGRIAVITFHSLEDRIVKKRFREMENPCTCPPDFPKCICGKIPKGRVLTKKPIVPSTEELTENNRSRSAKLRVFERIVQ